MNDRTTKLEECAKFQSKSRFRHLYKLWLFVFSSTKTISCIYLVLFILLSLFKPLLALIWKVYIDTADVTEKSNQVFLLCFLLGAYWIINYLSELINSYMAVSGDGDLEQLDAVQANRQQEKLHTKIYKKLSRISPEFFEMFSISNVLKQVFEFVGNPATGVNREVMLKSYIIIGKTISLITSALSLWIFNSWLCLILLIAPLPVLWISTIGDKLRFGFEKESVAIYRKINYYQDIMFSNSAKEIKVLGLHDFFFNRWKSVADEFTHIKRKQIRKQMLLNILNDCIVNSLHIGCIIYVIILMTTGQISLGVFGAALSLTESMIVDTSHLLLALSNLIGKQQEAKQFWDLMLLPEEKKLVNSVENIEKLEIKMIKYRYPLTKRYVLKDINLSIQKGEKVAFVGENGAGKSTIIKLILGLIKPSDGQLVINGIPIEDDNSSNLSNAFSIVMQSPVQYATFTVKENVYMGNVSQPCNDVQIDSALEFSNISYLEKNKLLGKTIGGIELSGGEWQKIAIARAKYRARDFIVLDEPTSNLDPLVEAELFKKYLDLSEEKTVIFVTHRISAAALADRIIVFKNGNIVEDGTHAELYKHGGEYARLFREQAKWYNR